MAETLQGNEYGTEDDDRTAMEYWYDQQEDVDRGETAQVVGSGGDGEPVETIQVDHSPDEETDLGPTETNAVHDSVAVDDTAQSNRTRDNPDELTNDDGSVKSPTEVAEQADPDDGQGSVDDGSLDVDQSAAERISDAAEEQGSDLEKELGLSPEKINFTEDVEQARSVFQEAETGGDVLEAAQNGEIPTTVLAGAGLLAAGIYYVGDL